MASPSIDASSARKHERRIRGVRIVLLAFLITSAAVVTDFALDRVVEQCRRAEVLLQRLQGFAYRLSALEWQAVAEREMSTRIVARVQEAQDEMSRTMGSLEQLEANAGDLRSVRRTFDAYSRAMNEEFSLIRKGNLIQASLVDAALVDPAFDALTRALSTTGAAYGAQAKQMEQLAFFGSALIFLLAIVTIGALVWKTQKVQAAIDAAAEKQEALARRQDELRLFAENVPAMANFLDENLRYRFANKAFAESFGFTVESILGKHMRDVVGEEAYREIEDHYVQVLRGRPVTYQRTRTFANGESRHLEVKLLPQIGEHGQVLGCFSVATDITEHKLAEERIQRVAHHDSLTGLPNRLLFNDRLEQAISLAKRASRPFALLYLDLDRFKSVNDTLGHTAGDDLLKDVAARIRREVRESDTVARVGGDEFTVILPDLAGRAEADAVARKIVAALAAPFRLRDQKRMVDIGTSIGIALYPADGRDADALITSADTAMYRAKHVGDSVRFFEA